MFDFDDVIASVTKINSAIMQLKTQKSKPANESRFQK